MCTEDYKWHFDYVRLAWDAGFSFDKYKYPNLDKNKICLVDIDRIVKERDVASVERFLSTVVQYILENDQAELLDTNFVKMFRISQLSVEYLLFCKKYLDKTVVLLKKESLKLKEENKELKLFTEELENHISTLTKQSFISTFKCDKCSKAFSTEEYLSSHIKRRHSNDNRISPTTETHQLQSEIKQLKERLNIAEKLLQEKYEKSQNAKEDVEENENKLKVDEILDKFERFKNKVENDLKMLQLEKNFYEEKYSKLFDVMLESNKKEKILPEVTIHPRWVEKNQDLQMEKYPVGDTIDRIEMTTQTEKENIPNKKLHIETVHNKNIFEFKELDTDFEGTRKRNNIQDNIEQKINRFEEQIELKISSGLDNIEKQMQAFWGRLSEMELQRETAVVNEVGNSIPQQEPIQVVSKPKIKPRMKLSKPSKFTDDNKENAEKIKAELEKMCAKPEVDAVPVKTIQERSPLKISNIMYDSSQASESESKSEPDTKSDSDSESNAVEALPKKKHEIKLSPNRLKLGKSSATSAKKESHKKQVAVKSHDEINDVINDKLQELGISPSWKGIPHKTFRRALDIVRHQAKLAKKSYPNFDAIKKSIETSLKNKASKLAPQKVNRRKNPKTPKTVTNVINIRYRKKSKDLDPETETKPSPVTIKNRSLYDTDSDSDDLRIVKPLAKVSEAVPSYSAVIQELKASRSKNADTDSDVNSIILPREETTNEVHTKSALRSYPSVGSLTKKKVLFDIDTDKIEIDRTDQETSDRIVAADSSNIVKEVDNGKKQKKNDSSLSDFDLSEL